MDSKKLRRIIINNVALLLLSASVGIGATIVCIRQINRIAASLVEKKKLSLLLQQRRETLATLKRDIEQVGDTEQLVLAALPSVDNILSFIGTMESNAQQQNLQQTLEFGTPNAQSQHSEAFDLYVINYRIRLNANAPTLITYLKGFEQLPYFTSISSMHIGASSAKGWDDNSVITLEANMYAK